MILFERRLLEEKDNERAMSQDVAFSFWREFGKTEKVMELLHIR